ncbi:ankyrin repeat and SOCS box protein 14-like isoform X2 [Dunckerocampus dactyliophorus]|uniref:ankyrin repeat and SOCS box protein 14-like isoform X2 n=1 Tax=Dunckerocampus dactyliophorus TaxID=161453 RepID=UPI0024052D1F|nr:ankyrin repeat and SOCS box protein 14-like isoform X2 [Dunckerocampus dactyliophorus]
MEFKALGMEDEEEDGDDAAMQYIIEQSLQDSNKRKDVHRQASTTRGDRSSKCAEAIFTAIRQGREKLVEELCLKRRDSFLQTDSRGWTPLHEASAQTNQTILELTYGGRESVERQTQRGETPLFLAVERGLMDNASFLLQHGARPDTQNQHQDSPLLLAIRLGCVDLVKLLLQRGAAVNQAGLHGRHPLHEASRLGRAELVSLLLEAKALPDARSRFGLTPLALAAQAGHLEAAEVLLRKGADVMSQAQDEASILYEACASGDASVVELLLEYGADPNVAKQSGHLPIHRAAHRGHLHTLKLLIPITSMEDINNSGMSPLHCAAAGGHTHCIKVCVHSPDDSVVHANKHEAILQALLDEGFDPNYMLHPCVRRGYDDERKSALFFAVSNDDLPSVCMLLEAGAMTNQDPVKCLQVALRLGNYELIKVLLRFGANVNFYSRINTTHFPSALQYALNDEVVLRMLCSYGYHVERCFDCPYGNGSHVPEDYEGWSNTVIKDTMVTRTKTHNGHMLPGGTVCVFVSTVLRGDHRFVAQASLRSCGSGPAGLCGSCDNMLQAEGGPHGAAAVERHLQDARERSLPAASLSFEDSSLSRSPSSAIACLHELPAIARTT